MNLYKTDDMLGTVLSLAKRHRHVVLRNSYAVQHSVRMRLSKITQSEMRWFTFAHWRAEESASMLARWRELGGILVVRSKLGVDIDLGPVDAILFPEAPLDMFGYELAIRDVAYEAVIYRPLDWQEHELTASRQSPASAACKAGVRFINQRLASGLNRMEKSYVKLAGFDIDRKLVFIGNRELSEALGLHMHEGFGIRKFVYRQMVYGEGRPREFYRIRLLFRPDQPGMAQVYDFLDDHRLAKFDELLVPVTIVQARFALHRVTLKEMARCGFIEFSAVRLYGHQEKFVFEKADLGRRVAVSELEAVKALVHSAPWYPFDEELTR